MLEFKLLTATAGTIIGHGVSLWRHRSLPLARCGFIWWVFASVAFLVDGAYLWSKPDDTWFQIWMTIAIALGVGSRPGFARHDGD